jgi:hypothetical protein
MKKPGPTSPETAELLAIQALAFIAQEPERLNGFLSVTGILGGVLEHMLGDESLLIAFAEAAGIDPAEIARARQTLGGSPEHDPP